MVNSSTTLRPNDEELRDPLHHKAEDHPASSVSDADETWQELASADSFLQEGRMRNQGEPRNSLFVDPEETEDDAEDDMDPHTLHATTGTSAAPPPDHLEYAYDSDTEPLVSVDSEAESSEVSEAYLVHQNYRFTPALDFGTGNLTTFMQSSTIQGLPAPGDQSSASDNYQKIRSILDDFGRPRHYLSGSSHVTSEPPSRVARSQRRAAVQLHRSSNQNLSIAQPVASSASKGRDTRSASNGPSSLREPVESNPSSNSGDRIDHSRRGHFRPRRTSQTQQGTHLPDALYSDQLTTIRYQPSQQSSNAERTSLGYPHQGTSRYGTGIAPVGETSCETSSFASASYLLQNGLLNPEGVSLYRTDQPTIRGGIPTTRRKRRAVPGGQKRRRITPASTQPGNAHINHSSSTDDEEMCLNSLNPLMSLPQAIWEIGAELLRIQSTMQAQYRCPLGPNGEGWPTNAAPYEKHPRALPVEIFELIAKNLPRDSVQSMRLVNREFERKISRYAFRSVVVPFKPKIYGSTDPVPICKGKGKAKEIISDDEIGRAGRDDFAKSYNPNTIHVRDGMRVFEQWGPQIKKFALTFEVPENTLKGLVPKKKSSTQSSWWGEYEWPHLEYNRYEQAAKLEEKADETSAMTTAFSKLTDLQEFGLSMSSGLGWLNGPDVSDRIRLFKPKPVIFGSRYALPDRELRKAMEEWDKIVEEQTWSSKRMTSRANRGFFRAGRDYTLQTILPKVRQRNIVPTTAEIRPPIMFKNVNMEVQKDPNLEPDLEPDLDNGMIGTPRAVISARTGIATIGLSSEIAEHIEPRSLTPEQEEWLMEMEWAQGAFLTSWCIALLDNPSVFQCLRTFNIANLSSGLLPWLQRDDIWRALPSLKNLTVLVSPDWRKVSKNEQGEVVTELIRPSSAASLFYSFLCALFGKNKGIKTLKIGYVGGGENAPGMFARNQNVIPAPMWHFPDDHPGAEIKDTLFVPHLEHFTLTNCWLAPTATTNFFAGMRDSNLQTVVFDSVSLATDSRSRPQGPVQGAPAGGVPAAGVPAAGVPAAQVPVAIPIRRNSWLHSDPEIGSWSDVINTITPGHGINHMRYFHTQTDMDEPALPPQTALKSITFTSCGYVRLANVPPTDLDQSAVADIISYPQCLCLRRATLHKVMMGDKSDTFLGTIVPALSDEEEGCLKGVWGMEMGWPEEREKEKWDAREDGMGEGGLGRFSGKVVSAEEDAEGGYLHDLSTHASRCESLAQAIDLAGGAAGD
ncbi:MAG: hypothetical protein LQ348_003824 [Seirophora lacunosa]|nr:MAG: hypothetical protein LQ348_003824 [Seirophora lacunosa]